MKSSLEWTTIKLLNTQEFALIFYNNALKSKAATGNNRRRIFSFRVPLSWCRCSSAMTCTFVQADASTASVSHLYCSLSSGMHCTWNLAEGSTYPSLSYQGPTNYSSKSKTSFNRLFAWWLLRPESFRVLLSWAKIRAFVIQSSLGLPNLNMKGKTKRILLILVNWRHCAFYFLFKHLWHLPASKC